MTARTSSSWSACAVCGAVVADRDLHDQRHAEIDDRLAVLEERLAALGAEPAPAEPVETNEEGTTA